MTDKRARQAPTQVLTNPELWRCITSFQRGLPVPLYAFWVAHGPSEAQSSAKQLPDVGKLTTLIITQGTVELLSMLAKVVYRTTPRAEFTTPDLGNMVPEMIAENRADMLEWVIAHGAPMTAVTNLWDRALTSFQEGDFRVLEVLRTKQPIRLERRRRSPLEMVKNVALVRWIDEHFPNVLDGLKLMHRAISTDNAAVIKYLLESRMATNFGTGPFQWAVGHGFLDIVQLVLEKRPTEVNRDVVRHMIATGDKAVVKLLVDVSGFEDMARDLAEEYVAFGNLEMVRRLLDGGLLPSAEPFSIDEAASNGHVGVIQLLTERNLATASMNAMDRAAEHEHWDVVMYLHKHRTEGCTTRVMDAAAAQGRFNQVKYFHENRSEGCTTRAMDEAARVGTLSIVRFLHENRTEGCTTEAMDGSASNGRLHVVKFLHENRSEGCTTNAMDSVSGLKMVQFLHANRTEGCTATAVTNALKRSRFAVTHFLYEHYPSLFGPELLHDLLLYGAFDIWTKLRETYPDQAEAVLEPVMVLAGEEYQLTTIHYVVNDLGRADLAYLAVDGAAKLPSKNNSNPQWQRAVMAVTGPKSCRLSAVRNAVVKFTSHRYSTFTVLQYLISVCVDGDAGHYATSLMREYVGRRRQTRRSDNDHSDTLQEWVVNGGVLGELPPLNPLLLDPRCPSWAVPLALNSSMRFIDHFYRFSHPPWGVRAVYFNSRELLELLRDLRVEDHAFSLEGARAAAVRMGNLPLLQWMLRNIELPIEPTLLDEALYYHQFEIAEWLAANCVEACRQVDWDFKVSVEFVCPCDIKDGVLLDWIEAHAAVRDLVDFGGIAYYAARVGDVAALQQLYQTHPDAFDTQTDLAGAATENDKQDVMAFLEEIGYAFIKDTTAKIVDTTIQDRYQYRFHFGEL